MKTEVMLVTPKMAREWLKRNTINRDLRPSNVKFLRQQWDNGNWRIVHPGIAFDENGNVLDGQHRLVFISELDDGLHVPINVTTNAHSDSFDAIDIGAKRSTSDIHKIPAGLAAVATFTFKIALPARSGTISPAAVLPFIEWVEDDYLDLMAFCPTPQKMWSSSVVRSAAILQMKRGYDRDFIKIAYESLVTADVDSMPHAARALMRQYMQGKVSGARSLDLFCRALRVFDSSQTGRINHIAIADTGPIVAEVREFILKQMKKSPDQAGLKVVKPSRNFTARKAA